MSAGRGGRYIAPVRVRVAVWARKTSRCSAGLACRGGGAARVKSAAEAQTHGNLVAVDGFEGLRDGLGVWLVPKPATPWVRCNRAAPH
jgi:hypothetical protein